MKKRYLKKVTAKKDIVDLKGHIIRKGLVFYITKFGPVHPTDGYKVAVIRVDNGTDDLSLMPETAIRIYPEKKNVKRTVQR